MADTRKITIIEGPPPTFELVNDTWLLGLTECSIPTRVALCRVRTLNGPALVERCYQTWRDGQPINLEYRTKEGQTQQAPIIAVRWVEQPEGHVLLLWLRLKEDEIEIEIDFDIDGFDDYPDEDGDDIDSTLFT
jgi:hypothetical protein